jgi:hypothetical protein
MYGCSYELPYLTFGPPPSFVLCFINVSCPISTKLAVVYVATLVRRAMYKENITRLVDAGGVIRMSLHHTCFTIRLSVPNNNRIDHVIRSIS